VRLLELVSDNINIEEAELFKKEQSAAFELFNGGRADPELGTWNDRKGNVWKQCPTNTETVRSSVS